MTTGRLIWNSSNVSLEIQSLHLKRASRFYHKTPGSAKIFTIDKDFTGAIYTGTMFGIGLPELIVIAVVALLVVGPDKLPGLAKSLGKGFQEFRRATDDVTESIKDTLKPEDIKKDVDDFKNSLLYGKEDEKDKETTPKTQA